MKTARRTTKTAPATERTTPIPSQTSPSGPETTTYYWRRTKTPTTTEPYWWRRTTMRTTSIPWWRRQTKTPSTYWRRTTKSSRVCRDHLPTSTCALVTKDKKFCSEPRMRRTCARTCGDCGQTTTTARPNQMSDRGDCVDLTSFICKAARSQFSLFGLCKKSSTFSLYICDKQ